jgi:hypothetical protein
VLILVGVSVAAVEFVVRVGTVLRLASGRT